jgi:predicted dehydrogenase
VKLEKIGVGIIGCGGIAVAKHIPNLLKDPRVEIRGIYEEFDQKRALSAIEEFGLKFCTLYGSLEQMLAEDAIAVVHVCTPNNTHAKLSIQALKAGKHVMCEKPMATSTSDAEDLERN